MKAFAFVIEVRGKRELREVYSKHLQGAIRRLYQEERYPFEIKKIL